MTKNILVLLSILCLLMFSCDNQTTNTEPIDQPIQEASYHLSFKVTCWKNLTPNPFFCDVEIFKNGSRQERGSNYFRTGWYLSQATYFHSNDRAKIIIKDLHSKEILYETVEFTQSENPDWFVDSKIDVETIDPASNDHGYISIGLCD